MTQATTRTRLTAYVYLVFRRLGRRRFGLRFIILAVVLATIALLSVFPGENEHGIRPSRLSLRFQGGKAPSEDAFDWLDDESDVGVGPSIKQASSGQRTDLLRRVLSTSWPKRRDASEHHRYAPNGLLEVNALGSHPIFELLESADKKWQEKLSRSSRTLREAVVEYHRRYRRMPPKGFDKWWSYIVKHDVQLPDEYDRIDQDMSPFWGMRPRVLQQLQLESQEMEDTFTIGIEDRLASVTAYKFQAGEWERSGTMRALEQLDQLEALQQWLPDFNVTFSMDDGKHGIDIFFS